MRPLIALFTILAFASCSRVNGSSALPSTGRPQASGGYAELFRFKGGTNGEYPYAGLIALDGTFHGTTVDGGAHSSYCSGGCGTVFSLSPSGQEHVLHRFTGGKDGAYPFAGLVALNGTLYGTTSEGGSGNCPVSGSLRRASSGSNNGCGTVFSVSTSGKESVIYSFKGGNDGDFPNGLIAVGGTLYGTTAGGGESSSYYGVGCGVLFSVTTSGKESVLYAFTGSVNAASPRGTLLYYNSMFYGAAGGGGNLCASYPNVIPCGTVFAVSMSGKGRTLHRFGKGSDAAFPDGGLIRIGSVLYGATGGGGTGYCRFGVDGCGTIFTITTSGKERVLYSFQGSPDGYGPSAPLLAVNGMMYGTTTSGGSGCKSDGGCGTVFSITTSGTEKVLYDFHASARGGLPEPNGGLIYSIGAFYGTTCCGGISHFGNAFRFSPGPA